MVLIGTKMLQDKGIVRENKLDGLFFPMKAIKDRSPADGTRHGTQGCSYL